MLYSVKSNREILLSFTSKQDLRVQRLEPSLEAPGLPTGRNDENPVDPTLSHNFSKG